MNKLIRLFGLMHKQQKGMVNGASLFFMIIGAITLTILTTVIVPLIMDVTSRISLSEALSVLAENGYVAYGAPAGDWTTLGDLYTQDIYPQADSTYDQGTNANRYRAGYFDALYGNLTGNLTTVFGAITTANVTTLNAPTGRGATYVVAATDAPAHVKAQADYVCDGTADNVEIQAAIDAVSDTYGGTVHLTRGIFTIAATIDMTEKDGIVLEGESSFYAIGATPDTYFVGSVIKSTTNIDSISVGNNATKQRGLSIRHLTISGSGAGNGKIGIKRVGQTPDQPVFENIAILNYGTGFKIATDYGHFIHCTVLFCATGFDADTDTVYATIDECGFADLTGTAIVGVDLSGAAPITTPTKTLRVENTIIVRCGGDGVTGASIVNGCEIGDITGTGINGSQTVTSNRLWNCATAGISAFKVDDFIISNNTIWGTTTWDCINTYSDGAAVKGIITGNNVTGAGRYGIQLNNGTIDSTVIGNTVLGNTTAGIGFETSASYLYNPNVKDNVGYIRPGEVRTASGTLTGGAVNAILFSWHNPEAQDIYIKKVVITITTADADAANIDVGIADDATYTNGGTEFFNDLTGETILVYDSWVVGDNGQQTKWVLCQDSASATDGWVVAKILDNDGTSIVGSYYIEFVGK